MSKLLKLREWLTVGEAAKRLTISAQEDVTEANVLRLALDGHLTLSVHFVNHAQGRPVRIEPVDKQPETSKEEESFLAEHNDLESSEEAKKSWTEFVRKYRGDYLPNGQGVLIYEGDGQKPVTLEGVWDLLMLGAEQLDVEHAYQYLTDGPAVELVCLGGPLVSSPDRSHIFQLLDSYKRNTRLAELRQSSAKPPISKETRLAMNRLNNMHGEVAPLTEESLVNWDYETVYYPAAGLPKDHTLVVRTAALRELEKKLLSGEAEPDKPLHPSERKSASQIIAALAAMAGLDLSSPYSADETLRKSAALNGLNFPASPETVKKFLNAATALSGKD